MKIKHEKHLDKWKTKKTNKTNTKSAKMLRGYQNNQKHQFWEPIGPWTLSLTGWQILTFAWEIGFFGFFGTLSAFWADWV